MKCTSVSLLLLGLMTFACSKESSPVSKPDMINGTAVPAGQYGSTVVYLLPTAQNKGDPNQRCTGVKVSPRHILTAAHCLVDEFGLPIDTLNQPNAKLELSNFGERDTRDTSLWHSGYIKITRSSPGYEEAVGICAEATPPGAELHCKDRWDMPSELAIVEFTADLPAQWPTAKIDLRPVNVGETVALVGYGHQLGRFSDEPKVKKNFANAVVRDWSEMKPLIAEDDVDDKVAAMTDVAFVTRGTLHPDADISTTVGLMPGDSGGPVYRAGTNNVVGIHRAVYWSGNDPLFHLHSRLSSGNPAVQEATERFLRLRLPASSFVP